MIKVRFFIGVLFLLINTSMYGFYGASANIINKVHKSSKSLSNEEIKRLSKLSDEVSGTKKIGKYLGSKHLPNEVLEDTYVRIATHQRKVSRVEAEEFYTNLHGVNGFRSTMSKVIGNNSQKTIGHLNELKIANSASKNGFKVQGIGVKYHDGLKQAPTDIDIVLVKDKKVFIIEAKNYSLTTKLPMDKYRSDLNTLNAYKKEHRNKKVIPIFSITNKPIDKGYLTLLKKEAKRKNVELIFGSPSQQVIQVNELNRIIK